MPKKFYVTTPIYYPSGNLHIGHAYTTTLADILKRYKDMQGYETYFLTGSDEHGQKIEQKANEAGQTPMEYLEDKVESFKTLWNALKIDYTKFIRTTDEYHEKTVQKIFSLLLENGFIYKGNYEGLYCVSCEEFLNADQIDENNMCKISNTKLELVKEETYFLKTSLFQDFMENEVLASDFLIPAYRRNEMLNSFVKPELKDLSVTRTSFSWGIPIKENPDHVVYVWLDALTNYITALGYMQEDHTNFDKFWNDENTEILQLAGKEIIRFHSIYWPIILKALDLRQPTHLLGHGWILSKDTKMSKSLGNVIDPVELINEYGADALRFYVGYELPTEKDGNFTTELFIESFNAHLANNIGNLISRTNQMISKYFEGYLDITNVKYDSELIIKGKETIDQYIINMDQYKISDAIRNILDLGNVCNKYIEEKMPWNLAKEENFNELKNVMATLQRSLSIIVYLMKPILVENYENMIEQIGLENVNLSFEKLKEWNEINFNKLNDKKIIFKRVN
ncbi:methionine--tRNA ligase [Mesoplasma chauliocola]|uniref:Methionine--tRNA ligase n=1 Tax=Mesoplasma chauliocola TaxID=216427 RepID=A0A249SMF3_9MOLU|nr:methionine--tRNA ligase [Mesoplasma chauliocola]ASZ08800.1 methionine--tRNA ligase [Mesoplasma chauliocola]